MGLLSLVGQAFHWKALEIAERFEYDNILLGKVTRLPVSTDCVDVGGLDERNELERWNLTANRGPAGKAVAGESRDQGFACILRGGAVGKIWQRRHQLEGRHGRKSSPKRTSLEKRDDQVIRIGHESRGGGHVERDEEFETKRIRNGVGVT